MAEMKYYDSNLTGQELDEAFRNLANLDDGIARASASAEKAQQSAQAAQQAAQEALGFRTFFSSVIPDANGDLDPSRPMTTPTAASVTVKSKGDRIQSVQVNGFTTQAGTGDPSPTNVREISTAGLRMVEKVFDGGSDENWLRNGTIGFYLNNGLSDVPALPKGYTNQYIVNSTGSDKTVKIEKTSGASGVNSILYVYDKSFDSVESFKAALAENPLTVWYVPADESQATGLYIPIQAQGHEYRCEMMDLTAPLCNGDKVESCVPSGCDVKMILDGSQSVNWVQNSAAPYGGYFQVSAPGLPSFLSGSGVILADRLRQVDNNLALFDNGVMVASTTAGKLNFTLFGQKSVGDANVFLETNPISIHYRSTAYTDQNDIPVQLEAHANALVTVDGTNTLFTQGTDGYTVSLPNAVNGAVTCNRFANLTAASNAVTIPASQFPSSVTDVDSANTWAQSNPVTILYPLSTYAIYAHDPVTLVAVPYTADDSDQTAGTYTISSQDGTTVAVSLKALQDGGDAATLCGLSLDDIKKLISDAVTAAVQMAKV